MASIRQLPSGNWQVQIRREGRVDVETFLRKEHAREWVFGSGAIPEQTLPINGALQGQGQGQGLWHTFFVDPDLPESKEVYNVIRTFFERHLGRRSRRP
jgi:hypothetical protein